MKKSLNFKINKPSNNGQIYPRNLLVNDLNKLKEQINCPKNFRCIKASMKDRCKVKYNALADLMECLDMWPKTCKFSMPFGATHICKCRLRKQIAIHFEEI